jgi:hypothetical protein
MNSKLLLCTALLVASVGSAFALAMFAQLTPANLGSLALIKSKPVIGRDKFREYFVVLLPQKGNDLLPSNWTGNLELNDGTNRLASCNVDGVLLSDHPGKSWHGAMESERYWAMTNMFSRPLGGAKVFRFEVATNLLATSRFAMYDRDDSSYTVWFTLNDFGNER